MVCLGEAPGAQAQKEAVSFMPGKIGVLSRGPPETRPGPAPDGPPTRARGPRGGDILLTLESQQIWLLPAYITQLEQCMREIMIYGGSPSRDGGEVFEIPG